MRDHRAGEPRLRAAGDVARRGDRVLPRARRAVQGRDPRGHRCAAGVALSSGRLHRPLPRAARRVDGPGEALQAPLVLRRLLARRRAKPDAPADLRHRLAHPGGARQASLAPRRGQEARSPQARARARPVRHPRCLAGRAVLAAERLDRGARARAVRARIPGRAGLPGDLHADPRQQAALGAVGTLGALPGQHVHGRGRGAALQPQADELSRSPRSSTATPCARTATCRCASPTWGGCTGTSAPAR